MEIVHFNIKPQNFIRTLIQLIYEQNIDQYKQFEMNLNKLKFLTYDFLFTTDYLTDEFIDKICSNVSSSDVIEISTANNFRYKLWNELINSDEYIEYINKHNILEHADFDIKELVNEYQEKYWIETN